MTRVLQEVSACRQVQLALVLHTAGLGFVIVGGTARFLRGAQRMPRDLDVAVRPSDSALLDRVLAAVSAGQAGIVTAGPGPHRRVTSWSLVDVFVQDEVPAWSAVVVDGVGLRVADG